MRKRNETREFLEFKRAATEAKQENFAGVKVTLDKVEQLLEELDETSRNYPLDEKKLTPLNVVAEIQKNTSYRQSYPIAKEIKKIYESKKTILNESQVNQINSFFHLINTTEIILNKNFPISIKEYIKLLELIENQEKEEVYYTPLATIYKKILLEKYSFYL
ncbi:MAG: hypothetical protein PHR00_00820 [Patescibacteria group bacterium]|nr:hypothetical protein [Patescibacteria group bacterium]